jgi:signal transduction histidine kinase
MTAVLQPGRVSTSIRLYFFLTVVVLVAIAVAVFVFQYRESKVRDRSRDQLAEYHLATLLDIDRIKGELFELQARVHDSGAGHGAPNGSLDVSDTKHVIQHNFEDIVEKQKLFAGSAFTETLNRAEKRKREVLNRLDSFGSPDRRSGEIVSTDVRYFIESLDQLARMHLIAYQTQTDLVVAEQRTFGRTLLFFLSLISFIGAVVVFILLRRIKFALDRQAEAELKLIRLNENLENDIEIRTSELRVAKEAAEDASESKSRFLAAASHDLRQPMQAITILGYALKANLQDENARPLVEKLETNTDVVIDLLDELLDISKLDAGTLTPTVEAVPLATLLRNIEHSFAGQAREKGIDLRVVSSTAVVRTDPMFLGRILQNLVSNAIRYTDEGKILVGCRRNGAGLRIEVCDTGKGISESHLEKIFEEFYQVDNPARNRRQGMGLGLAIVQRLARSLGYTLKVSSVAGKGSRFSVTIPADHAHTNSLHDASGERNATWVEENACRID